MAVEIAAVITEEIDLKFNSVSFYTDSKVVLGYIHIQSLCFYVHINNRTAHFVTKLDLSKDYWQVPLTPCVSEISAFVTPYNFLQYKSMAFGM